MQKDHTHVDRAADRATVTHGGWKQSAAPEQNRERVFEETRKGKEEVKVLGS